MNIGIYSNLTRDVKGKATKTIANILEAKGISFAMSEELSSLKYKCDYLSNQELAKRSDIIMVLGGDGTILRIVNDCAKYDSAIFAINLGHLGFLTETENVKLNEAVDAVWNKKTHIEERDLLEVEYQGKRYCALNEVVIARGSRTKMIKIDAEINNIMVDRIHSDGIIISTPTGSTAYSLSAGGPIVTPDVEAIIMTPICPHSLHSRPIVINNKSSVKINLLQAEPCAYLNIDGDDIAEMLVGDSVMIAKSELKAKFIRFESYNFYANLQSKLNYWSFTDKE